MFLTMCRSGGQCGADIGGLRAAKVYKIPTGGWIPLGCLTENGKQPELLAEFNLQETETSNYRERTRRNVRDSDGTIRFANDWDSPGERCTLRAILDYKKPHLDVYHDKELTIISGPYLKVGQGFDLVPEAKEWIVSNNIRVLNVAGNRESTCPGIEKWASEFLLRLFVSLDNEK